MNGDKQREHRNVREELGEVAAATHEELEAIRGNLDRLQGEIADLRKALETGLETEQQARRALDRVQRKYIDGSVHDVHARIDPFTFYVSPLARLWWVLGGQLRTTKEQ